MERIHQHQTKREGAKTIIFVLLNKEYHQRGVDGTNTNWGVNTNKVAFVWRIECKMVNRVLKST